MRKTITTETNAFDIHSAEISQNTKGEISFSVKAYGSSPKVAADRAEQMFKQIDHWKTCWLPIVEEENKAKEEQG